MQNVEKPPETAMGLKKISRPPLGKPGWEKWKVLSTFPPFHTRWKRGVWKKENYGENRNFMETKRNQKKRRKRKSFLTAFFGESGRGQGARPLVASRRTRNPHATGSAGRAEKTSRWDVFSRGTLAPPTPKEINKRFFPCFRRSKGYWSCRFLIISSTISLSWELFFSLRSISCMA